MWSEVPSNGNNQHSYPHQDSSKAKQLAHVNVTPVQRVDSFNTSISSHEPDAVFSTASSFNFDHPTPVDSADEQTFQTPEIEDLLWQESYNRDNSLEQHTTGIVQDCTSDLLYERSSNTPPVPLSHKNSLPSPQSTNISTPEAATHCKRPSQNSMSFASPTFVQAQLKHSFEPEMGNDLPHRQYADLQTPDPTSVYATSPIIHVSSHRRGDSPARSEFEQRLSSKKRSASNLSQAEYFPDVQSSTLMPPSHEEASWNEHEDSRSGTAPTDRTIQEHPSFQDLDEQAVRDKAVETVQDWLQETTLNDQTRKTRGTYRSDRIRSRSTGARPNPAQRPILNSTQSPGPGILLDESSDYYYSTDDASDGDEEIEQPETLPTELPPRKDSEVAPDELGPLPGNFRRVEDTAAGAIYKWQLKTREFDAISRRATFGSTLTGIRRNSDGDVNSVSGEPKTRHLSLTKTRIREKSISTFNDLKTKAQNLTRSNSRSKQAQLQGHPELEKVQSPEPIDERMSSESQGRPTSSSYPKPKSPSIGSGLRGATGSLAAVGAGGTTPGLSVEIDQQEGFFTKVIRRVRSRSDVNRSPKSPGGLQDMIFQAGGMPVATLASPGHEMSAPPSQHLTPVQAQASAASTPISMSLSPRPANVMPNLEGFKVQISELNPRLASYLIDRIAHDQVRRYKRLVKQRVDHINICIQGSCGSGHLCSEVGGEAEILQTKSAGHETQASSAQFKIAVGVESDNEDSSFDGIVTPAAFPDGIPLPPTKKLPAKFECPLCFQIKTFQKPSDWTKHVHEDVQPFTCTFQNCQEPKSFKRKADWVRHENERHRHLEWWKCNLSECTHTCYRKDNFVQHLVREHKRKEPKIKGRTNYPGKGKGKSFTPEEIEFWQLVDSCRHENGDDARKEPCKFCGNVLPSWKKLSVHVGKHMEQIAMPVLDLAQKRNVTKDTIVSPIEPLQTRTGPFFSEQNVVDHNALSPYSYSGPSYDNSSVEHSPMVMHQQPYIAHRIGNASATLHPHAQRHPTVTSTPYTYGIQAGDTAFAYAGHQEAMYNTFPGQPVIYDQSNPAYIPRSSAEVPGFVGMHSPYGDQRQLYSSPEMQYVQYHGQPMSTQIQRHIQTPVEHVMNGHNYVYDDSWQQGR